MCLANMVRLTAAATYSPFSRWEAATQVDSATLDSETQLIVKTPSDLSNAIVGKPHGEITIPQLTRWLHLVQRTHNLIVLGRPRLGHHRGGLYLLAGSPRVSGPPRPAGGSNQNANLGASRVWDQDWGLPRVKCGTGGCNPTLCQPEAGLVTSWSERSERSDENPVRWFALQSTSDPLRLQLYYSQKTLGKNHQW